MPAYLLTCECGKSLPVDLGQAGGQVVCSCGAKLDVPTLRKLRHLPLAPADPTDRSNTTGPWNARKGTITVFLILAGLLAAISLWDRLTEPKLPTFDPTVQARFVDQEISRLTPVEAWQLWIQEYRPLAEKGFAVMESPNAPAIRAQIARQRFFQAVMLSIAGVCVALATITALWPGAKTRRQGDKETRRMG